MAGRSFSCQWAALSLSTIAGVFIPDIQLPREESETIRHKLVAVSTTGSEKRAHAWFEENKVVDSSLVKIYYDWEIMLEEADFDVVYISTPHPLHYQHVRHALERKRHVLVEKLATINAA